MLDGLKKMIGFSYEPLNMLEISSSRLKDNYMYLSSLNEDIKIAPVLKSNAYGHGIGDIGKELDRYQTPFLCVDSLYEGYELLKKHVKTPILILGYWNPKSINTKKLPFTYAVFTLKQVQAINKYQPHAHVHLFIDTGMHREGIKLDDLPQFLRSMRSYKNICINGMLSHLAMSSKPHDECTLNQIRSFRSARSIIEKEGIHLRWMHLVNSSGMLKMYPKTNHMGNMARVGIALYGIDPEGRNIHLKPILRLKSHVSQTKVLKKGDKVGYDFTYTCKKDTKIAILPIGYNDGVDRRLSNKGCVSIKGVFCPIIGRVSMNITTTDVTKVKKVHSGDEVVIYSDNPTDVNSIENSAKLCGTIPYELLIHLSPTIKRVLI